MCVQLRIPKQAAMKAIVLTNRLLPVGSADPSPSFLRAAHAIFEKL